MKFGSFDISPLETGRFKLDGGAMFGVVPKNLWERSNPADELNRIEMTMRSLLIRSGDRNILVDTGVGHKHDEKFARIFSIDFSEVSLTSSMEKLGIDAEEITDVVLTHLHFDHAGGCVIRENDELRLQFPNAIHYVQKTHWEWARKPSARDKASFFPENYLPIQEAGKLKLLGGDSELFPGIHVQVVNGHTFGQQLVRLESEGLSLLYAGDLFPMSALVPGPYIMGYDLQPLVTLEEKNRILQKCVDENGMLFFEHDAYDEAGLPDKGEKGFVAREKGSLEAMIALAVKRRDGI